MQRRYTKLYQIADLYGIMYRLAVLGLTATHQLLLANHQCAQRCHGNVL